MAAGLFLALAVRFAATDDPLAGVGRAAWVAIGGLSLLAAWAALSWLWSGAPARALLEADRVALYLAVFALFASRPWSDGRLRRVKRGVAGGAASVLAGGPGNGVLPGVGA